MRGTAAKRMLLRPDVATVLQSDVKRGVPIQRAMKNLGLECSRPTIAKLLDTMELAEIEAVTASLNPKWLDAEGEPIQSQPDGWRYIGRFPLGKWEQDSCSDS